MNTNAMHQYQLVLALLPYTGVIKDIMRHWRLT